MRLYGALISTALILSTGTGILVGCGAPEESGPTPFRYRIAGDPPSLDPIHTTDTTSATIVLKLFEGLVDQDPETLEVVPALAETWEIADDGLTYTFHLRRDVVFHNGRPVTSADFRYSFERCLRPESRSPRSWVLEPISGADALRSGDADTLTGMETPDEYTVVIRLDRPFAPFLSYLAMESGRVVAREGVDGDSFTPIGTGPYRFVRWDHDIRVVTEAWEGWHGPAPAVRRVEYEVIPDVGVAFQKFVAGELDLVNELPPGQLALIRERYPEAVKTWPFLRVEYLGLNHTRPPFKDNLTLRRALSWAVDRERIARDILEGASIPATGVLPPGIPGRDESLEGYGYDPDRARALLAEAGYPGGEGLPELTLWYNTNEAHQQVAQFIQATFRDIGVRTRLRSLDWPAYLKACESHEPDMYRLGWVADIPDADNFLYILLHSSQIGAAGNYSGFSDPEFDRLVEEARRTTDEQRRIELYKQADRLAVEQACWLIYGYPMQLILFNPAYEGLVLPKQGDFKIPVERLRRKAE